MSHYKQQINNFCHFKLKPLDEIFIEFGDHIENISNSIETGDNLVECDAALAKIESYLWSWEYYIKLLRESHDKAEEKIQNKLLEDKIHRRVRETIRRQMLTTNN